MIAKTVKVLEEVLIQSWWVILFILLCYMVYEQGIRKRNEDFAKLHEQYKELLKEKQKSMATQKELHLKVNSESDPAWIELTLMKGLGLVPEGQTKVLFIKEGQ
jgi:hypothetical protein